MAKHMTRLNVDQQHKFAGSGASKKATIGRQVRNKAGELKRYLVEIKPYQFTLEPKIPKRKTKRFLAEVVQYAVNQAKWKAARNYAADRGIAFLVITERDLGTL